ncbi:MAG: hypothetical protein JJ850_05245 [Kordiimonadaceae bacterium]|nr:hypothetical protein [Kordiimonadaceae bacterium]MBO6568273.1 hypothetical protein [Kordiimonadaceae bacterium]MBO6963997.1 hypothetical protein [Kordiimonadaceae bacterium]
MSAPAQSRQWVGRTFFESALIVVGIILGFIVNEWREDLQLEQKADLAMDRILQELELNREAVAGVLPYHEQIAGDLKALLENPPQKPLMDTFLQEVAPNGVGDLLLLDTAWKTANGRDSLAPFDFSAVQQLADVYDLAETGPQTSWTMIITFFADKEMYAPDVDGILLRRMSFAYDTLVMQEKALLQRYDWVIKEIREWDKPTEPSAAASTEG